MKIVSETEHGNYKVVVYEKEEIYERGFEIGKWYKFNNRVLGLFNEYGNNNIGFGLRSARGMFYCNDIWIEQEYIGFWQPADMNEVSKLMIAEAEKRGYLGSRLKDSSHKNPVYSGITLKLDGRGYSMPNGDLLCNNITIWSPEKGWAEIIEPLFVNSHGSKFYDKNESVSYVNKEENTILTKQLANIMNDLSESILYTEIMTKEQAEQYVKDHKPKRVFEDGCYYWVQCKSNDYDNKFRPAEYRAVEEKFFFAVHEFGYLDDEIVIGDKIEFKDNI